MTQNDQLNIAIVSSNKNTVGDLTKLLKTGGLYPHFFDGLQDFWVYLTAQTPDLVFYDYGCFSDGQTDLSYHPKIQAKELEGLVFFYEDLDPDLSPCGEVDHWGVIKKDRYTHVKIWPFIDRALTTKLQEKELTALRKKNHHLKERMGELTQKVQESYAFKKQYDIMLDVLKEVESSHSSDEFFRKLAFGLSGWEGCERYGFYVLNQSCQKLVTFKMIRPKYIELPELWLLEESPSGISTTGHEMAQDVVADLISKDIKVINLYGVKEKGEALLFIAANAKKTPDFPWEEFRLRLNNHFTRIKLAEATFETDSLIEVGPFDLLKSLDDTHFLQKTTGERAVLVNLMPMLFEIQRKFGNRFNWRAFYLDFMNDFNQTLNSGFRYSLYGASAIVFLIKREVIDLEYQKIKAIVNDFPYWRYFEDHNVFHSGLEPRVMMLAPSSMQLFNMLEMDGEKNLPAINREAPLRL